MATHWPKQNLWARYLSAIIILFLAFGIELVFSVFSKSAPFILLYPTVFLIARLEGFGPSFLTILLSVLGVDYFFFEHTMTFKLIHSQDGIQATIFLSLSTGVSWLIAGAQKNKKALAQSEKSLRDTFDKAAIGLAHVGLDGRWLKVNPRLLEITGYIENDLLVMGFADMTYPEDLKQDWELIQSILNGDVPEYSLEKRYLKKDGTIIWVHLRVALNRNEDGEPNYFIVSIDDISERKKFELALIEGEKRLQKTAQDLEAAVKTKDDFLSIASHELKTPLASLKLQTQLIQYGLSKNDTRIFSPDRIRKLVDHTDWQTNRLIRLVDDMLDATRIRVGKLTIEKEKIELCSLTREVICRMKPIITAAKTPIEVECLEERLENYCDRLRIEQVITNLMTNALRYGEQKPVHLNLARKNNMACLTIRDQGIGIEKTAQEKIFRRFERLNSTKEISGLGLGLFITRQIVELHEGRIWVESEGLGKGATFYVEIPVI